MRQKKIRALEEAAESWAPGPGGGGGDGGGSVGDGGGGVGGVGRGSGICGGGLDSSAGHSCSCCSVQSF